MAHGLRLLMGKLLWQELEATDPTPSTIRKQKDINTNDVHLTFSF